MTTARDWRDRFDALAAFPEPLEIEAIVCHKPTGAPIGAMCLAGIDAKNNKAEFSIGFLRGHGTRAITEAIHYALHYSFEIRGLRKLILHTNADNRQALAVLAKFGARSEGTFIAEMAAPGGGYADVERHALYRDSDWLRIETMLVRLAPLALTDA